jgi:hypothetical protein
MEPKDHLFDKDRVGEIDYDRHVYHLTTKKEIFVFLMFPFTLR